MVIACSYKILWPKIDFLIFLPHFPLSTGHFFQHGGQARKMQKKSFFCRNGLYPCWCRMCRGAVGFWGLFVFFDAPDNTSLFKIEESIILWVHPQSLCQVSHRTKTIRTIKFPLQLYSVHRSAGGKTGTVCLPAKIVFFGIKTCWS